MFGVISLVRDGDGEATHLSQWAGLAKRSPVLAGVMTFLLLALAGIPLTSGFTAKFAVFAAAIGDGMAPLVVIALVASAVAAFFYLRVDRADVLQRAAGGRPDRRGAGSVHHRRDHPGCAAHPACSVSLPTLALGWASARRVRRVAACETSAVAGVELSDPQLAAAVGAGMTAVEKLLHREVHSGYEFVTETSLHLIDAGGKRFRPLFTLLGAQIGPQAESPDVITAAAAVEMVHLATLYHDDVMDSAHDASRVRRARTRAGTTRVAILTGDFLFAHASRLVADLGPDAVRIIAETFAELVTGQMRETRGPGAGDDPVTHYLTVIAEKTGSLIATSGRFGGMFAGRHREQIDSLQRFGAIIGTAFQISDDIIDIASPTDSSGKTPGTDLREGVHTLPMLYGLRGTDAGAERLRVLLVRPIEDDAEVEEALAILRTGSGIDQAREALADEAAAARSELGKLPACPAMDAMSTLTSYVVDRTG